jgi:hypothetical protein
VTEKKKLAIAISAVSICDLCFRKGVSSTDYYADGVNEYNNWRRKWCKKAGLGFSLVGLKNVLLVLREKAA